MVQVTLFCVLAKPGLGYIDYLHDLDIKIAEPQRQKKVCPKTWPLSQNWISRHIICPQNRSDTILAVVKTIRNN